MGLTRQPTPFPLSQPSPMPTLTPHVSRNVSTLFGIPMVQPNQAGSLHQPQTRGPGRKGATVTRNQ